MRQNVAIDTARPWLDTIFLLDEVWPVTYLVYRAAV